MTGEILHWLPVDLPPFPHPEMDWDELTDYWTWRFKRFASADRRPANANELDPEVLQRYPLLADWLNLFPFKTIRNCKFNLQRTAMDAHVDFTHPEKDWSLYHNNVANEPCGYRTIISGSRAGKLFIQLGDEKIYPNMPEGTDTYLIRHTDTWHGVDDDPGRRTLFMHFEIDGNAHQSLLHRSLDRFGHLAVYGLSNKSIDDGSKQA